MNFSIEDLISSVKQDKRRAAIIAGVGVVILILILMKGFSGASGNQKLLTRSFANLLAAETFHTTASLDLQLPVQLGNRERPIVGLNAAVEGDVTYQDSSPVLSGTLNVEARGRGMVLFADGDLRILPDTTAFRLDDLPALLNPKGNLVEKWTYVNAPLLRTNNQEDVRAALTNIFQGMDVEGKEDGLTHFTREVTPEQEDIIIQVFRQGVSGNHGLQVVTRLLRAFNVSSLDIWVDEGDKEVRKISATFVRPDTDEQRATLEVKFSDYGKSVELDQPQEELTVRPEVFGKIFGSGDIVDLQ